MPTFELEESEFAGYMDDGTIWPAWVRGVKVADKPFTNDDGTPAKKVEFKFEIIDHGTGQFDGVNVWGETGTKFNTHPDCKLRNWSQAILATELPTGYLLDTDHLVGRQCRVYVEKYEYDDKKSAKNPDGTWQKKTRNRVTDVMPSSEAMAGMTSAAPAVGSAGGYADEEPF